MTAVIQLLPVAAPAETVRGRRTAWVVRALIAVIALAFVAAGLLVAGVQSVDFDDLAAVEFTGDAAVVTLPQFGERGSHVLLYEHGETITFTIPLENDSRLPVSITSVDLGDVPLSLLTVEAATMDARDLPVTIGAGETAFLSVTARFANCRYYHEREVQMFSAATIGARVLGMDVTRSVSLDHDLVIHSPMIVSCPDRTLDRNDDVRPVS